MWNRRELLKAFAAGSLGWTAGCRASSPIQGGFVGPSLELGHRLRQGGWPDPPPAQWEQVDVAIVGGGIAGLAAGRALLQAGIDRFQVFELEPLAGGTSQGGHSAVSPYPWGAHYLPVPLPENRPLIALLREMGVVEHLDSEGRPIIAEQFLCRDPQERLFARGSWHEGLLPLDLCTEGDRAELLAFQAEIDRWVAWRDGAGRRAFAIPVVTGSDELEVTRLDAVSFATWFEAQGFTSPQLRWLLDYACRDDYGCTLEQTSAWAGLFYFASRQSRAGADAEAIITWPEGNASIVRHLANLLGDRVRTSVAVCRIVPPDETDDHVRVTGFDARRNQVVGVRSRRVILATPQFLAPYLISNFPEERCAGARQFEYGAWLVANLHLRDRPESTGFPFAWDNVLRDSPSLGYVSATHQSGRDHGPTVLTYYLPFCDDDSRRARERLLQLSWEEARDAILADLEVAHAGIRQLVERIDVMRWGHAMIRPRVGFLWSAARRRAWEPWHGLHFAHTDLSGIALCEEAFAHGVRAAWEVVEALQSQTVRSPGE